MTDNVEGLTMKYFVLSPFSKDEKHSEASKHAIATYAQYYAKDNPKYCSDLLNWIKEDK